MNFFKYNDTPLISSYKFKIKLEGIEITKINSISASASINADIKFSISIPAVDGVLNLLPKTVCEVYMQDANFYAHTVIKATKSYKIGDVLNQNDYNSYLAKIQGDLAKRHAASTFFKKTKPWVLMCVGELDTINYSRTPSSVFCNMQFTGLFGNFQQASKWVNGHNTFANQALDSVTYGIPTPISLIEKSIKETETKSIAKAYKTVAIPATISTAKANKTFKDLASKYTGNFEFSHPTHTEIVEGIATILVNLPFTFQSIRAVWIPGNTTTVGLLSFENLDSSDLTFKLKEAVNIITTRFDLYLRVKFISTSIVESPVTTSLLLNIDYDYISQQNPDERKKRVNAANDQTRGATYTEADFKAYSNSNPKETIVDDSNILTATQLNATFNNVNLTYLSKLFETSSVSSFWIDLITDFTKSNPFLHLTNKRYEFKTLVNVINNKKLLSILKNLNSVNLLEASINGQAGITNLYQLIQTIFAHINYIVAPQLFPSLYKAPINETSSISVFNYYNITPMLDYVFPPVTNILKEEDIQSFDTNIFMSATPTRFVAKQTSISATMNNTPLSQSLVMNYFAPNDILRQDLGDGLIKTVTPVYTNEEVLRGVIPGTVQLSGADVSLAAKANTDLKTVTDKTSLAEFQALNKKLSEPTESDGKNITSLTAFYQAYVTNKFLEEKYSKNSVNVTINFNPYLTLGLPVLIVSKITSLIGTLETISHTYNAEGALATSISLSNIRIIAKNSILPVFPSGFNFYIDQTLQDNNISKQYNKLIDPKLISLFKFLDITKENDSTLSFTDDSNNPITYDDYIQKITDLLLVNDYTKLCKVRIKNFITEDEYIKRFPTKYIANTEFSVKNRINNLQKAMTINTNELVKTYDARDEAFNIIGDPKYVKNSNKTMPLYFETRADNVKVVSNPLEEKIDIKD